ncbi:MAG TPA: hypothetical protein VFG91_13720 [Woeseiaceae bacterium]|nr:hypothetical protein [Woeseiaceae bacterium]
MSCEERCQAITKTRGPREWHGTLACALAASLLVLLLPGPATAQQWLFTPEIEIGAHHVDNPRLAEQAETDAITGGLVDAGLAMRRNTQTSSVLLRPRAVVYRYTDAPDEDSEAYFLDFNAQTETQRSTWGIRANYRQQQVFRGETTSAEFGDGGLDDGIGIDDDVQTGTGRTFTRRQRDLWRVNPHATMELTQVTSLRVDLSYLDVQYDTEELGEATDYNNSQVEAALVHALSRHSDLSASVFAARYDPTSAERQTDSAGARVRYEQSISDISSFFVDVGVQESRAESAADPDFDISKTSFLWNLGLDRQLEVTRWRFELGRRVTPSGSGSLVERDLVRAVMDHQFQPRWSLQLAAVAMQTNAVAEDISENDRDYLQGRATLAWQWTRSWTVEGRYSLTHQDFSDIPGDAQEHEIRLSFIYRPPLPTQ